MPRSSSPTPARVISDHSGSRRRGRADRPDLVAPSPSMPPTGSFRAAPTEFWWPRGESLKDVLAVIPQRYSVVQALVRSFAGPRGVGSSPTDDAQDVAALGGSDARDESPHRMLRADLSRRAEPRDRPRGLDARRPPRAAQGVVSDRGSTSPLQASDVARGRVSTRVERSVVVDTRLKDALRGASRRERGLSRPPTAGIGNRVPRPDIVDDAVVRRRVRRGRGGRPRPPRSAHQGAGAAHRGARSAVLAEVRRVRCGVCPTRKLASAGMADTELEVRERAGSRCGAVPADAASRASHRHQAGTRWPHLDVRELWHYRELLGRLDVAGHRGSLQADVDGRRLGDPAALPDDGRLHVRLRAVRELPLEGRSVPDLRLLRRSCRGRTSLPPSRSPAAAWSRIAALVTKVYFPRVLLPLAGVTVPIVDFVLALRCSSG